MSASRPVRGLFFDLDETLLDDNRSYDASVRATCNDLAGSLATTDVDKLFQIYRRISEAYWLDVADEVMRGVLDGRLVRLESWRRALDAIGTVDEAVASLALDTYSRHRNETYALFDDAAAVLESLAGRLPLALITNGSSVTQWEKAHRLGLALSFNIVVVSGDVGVAKPDPAIFRVALDKLGINPAEVMHVGDSLTSDVAGAKAAGLKAVWLNRHGAIRSAEDPQPDHEIRSLRDLPPLLGLDPQPYEPAVLRLPDRLSEEAVTA